MSLETVNSYAEDMLAGDTFPPIIVYRDGEAYYLADGYHRVEAARKIDRHEIEAEIRDGTAREAILTGIGANATHGLRRTNADKRRAIERLLADPEWARWSDRQIAKTAKVSHPLVAKIRADLSETGKITSASEERERRAGKITSASGEGSEECHAIDSGSMLSDFLQTVTDADLIAECHRRRLQVEASEVSDA